MPKKLTNRLLSAFAGMTLITSGCLWLPGNHTQATITPPATMAAQEKPAGSVATRPAFGPGSPRLTAVPAASLSTTTNNALRLVKQLVATGNEEGLFQLKTLLSAANSAEGLAVTRALLRDSSPTLRQVGVDILSNRSLTDPEVHQLAVRTLAHEQDPGVLIRLLANLDAPIDAYGKDVDMSSALHALLNHTDADVRSQAVLQLLQWDDYSTLEGYLYQALNDVSGEVRLSAATVISLIDTRSTTLKGALLALRDNPQESRDIHESVVAALNRIDDYNHDFPRYP